VVVAVAAALAAMGRQPSAAAISADLNVFEKFIVAPNAFIEGLKIDG
jgi:hypothetical protein